MSDSQARGESRVDTRAGCLPFHRLSSVRVTEAIRECLGRARRREFDTDRSIDHCSHTRHTHTHALYDRAQVTAMPWMTRGIKRRHHLFRDPWRLCLTSPRLVWSLLREERHEFLFRQLRPSILSLIRSVKPFCVSPRFGRARCARTSSEFRGETRTQSPFSKADRGMGTKSKGTY